MKDIIEDVSFEYSQAINKKLTPILILDRFTGDIVDANLTAEEYYSYTKKTTDLYEYSRYKCSRQI